MSDTEDITRKPSIGREDERPRASRDMRPTLATKQAPTAAINVGSPAAASEREADIPPQGQFTTRNAVPGSSRPSTPPDSSVTAGPIQNAALDQASMSSSGAAQPTYSRPQPAPSEYGGSVPAVPRPPRDGARRRHRAHTSQSVFDDSDSSSEEQELARRSALMQPRTAIAASQLQQPSSPDRHRSGVAAAATRVAAVPAVTGTWIGSPGAAASRQGFRLPSELSASDQATPTAGEAAAASSLLREQYLRQWSQVHAAGGGAASGSAFSLTYAAGAAATGAPLPGCGSGAEARADPWPGATSGIPPQANYTAEAAFVMGTMGSSQTYSSLDVPAARVAPMVGPTGAAQRLPASEVSESASPQASYRGPAALSRLGPHAASATATATSASIGAHVAVPLQYGESRASVEASRRAAGSGAGGGGVSGMLEGDASLAPPISERAGSSILSGSAAFAGMEEARLPPRPAPGLAPPPGPPTAAAYGLQGLSSTHPMAATTSRMALPAGALSAHSADLPAAIALAARSGSGQPGREPPPAPALAEPVRAVPSVPTGDAGAPHAPGVTWLLGSPAAPVSPLPPLPPVAVAVQQPTVWVGAGNPSGGAGAEQPALAGAGPPSGKAKDAEKEKEKEKPSADLVAENLENIDAVALFEQDEDDEDSDTEDDVPQPWYCRPALLWFLGTLSVGLVLLLVGVLLQVVFTTPSDVFRWFYFFAAMPPLYYGLSYAVKHAFMLIEWWFFRESLLYLVSVQRKALWLLYFLALLPWYCTVFRWAWCASTEQRPRRCQQPAYTQAINILWNVLLCLMLFCLANLLKAVLAKLLTTHFYRTAHFKKLKKALEKEYALQVLSRPRRLFVATRTQQAHAGGEGPQPSGQSTWFHLGSLFHGPSAPSARRTPPPAAPDDAAAQAAAADPAATDGQQLSKGGHSVGGRASDTATRIEAAAVAGEMVDVAAATTPFPAARGSEAVAAQSQLASRGVSHDVSDGARALEPSASVATGQPMAATHQQRAVGADAGRTVGPADPAVPNTIPNNSSTFSGTLGGFGGDRAAPPSQPGQVRPAALPSASSDSSASSSPSVRSLTEVGPDRSSALPHPAPPPPSAVAQATAAGVLGEPTGTSQPQPPLPSAADSRPPDGRTSFSATAPSASRGGGLTLQLDVGPDLVSSSGRNAAEAAAAAAGTPTAAAPAAAPPAAAAAAGSSGGIVAPGRRGLSDMAAGRGLGPLLRRQDSHTSRVSKASTRKAGPGAASAGGEGGQRGKKAELMAAMVEVVPPGNTLTAQKELHQLTESELEKVRTAIVIKTQSALISKYRDKTDEAMAKELGRVRRFAKALFFNVLPPDAERDVLLPGDFLIFFEGAEGLVGGVGEAAEAPVTPSSGGAAAAVTRGPGGRAASRGPSRREQNGGAGGRQGGLAVPPTPGAAGAGAGAPLGKTSMVHAADRAKASRLRSRQRAAEDGARKAFAVFDADSNGEVSLPEVREAVVNIYKERRNMARSLKDTETIVQSLEFGIGGVIHFVFAAVYLLIWGVDLLTGFSTFSATVLALTFVFGNSVKNMYESMLFLFVIHPYDVGDCILVGTEMYRVKKISLLYTDMVKSNGERVYMPNTALINTAVINWTRSKTRSESCRLVCDIGVAWEAREDIQAALRAYAREHPGEFDGEPSCNFRELADPLKVVLVCSWTYNFAPDEFSRLGPARNGMLFIVQQKAHERRLQNTTYTETVRED